MAINKVIDRNNNTLLDLTFDTVTPNKVLSGETFHDKYGNTCIGTLDSSSAGKLDTSKYNFIDYEGTLLYSLTDAEIDALEEMPQGADHTGENLTFQEWNWTLEGLKSWNRNRAERPIIGANYITTDRKTYIYLDIPRSNVTLSFSVSSNSAIIDWGDGETTTGKTSLSHTYSTPGEYIVIIEIPDSSSVYITGTQSYPSMTSARQFIKHIRLGNLTQWVGQFTFQLVNLETISVPALTTCNPTSGSMYDCSKLKNIVFPISTTEWRYDSASNLESIKTFSIPQNMQILQIRKWTSLKNIVLNEGMKVSFSYCTSLEKLFLPDNTNSSEYLFMNCYSLKDVTYGENIIGTWYSNDTLLEEIVIPEGITQIGDMNSGVLKKVIIKNDNIKMSSGCFDGCNATIDLSQLDNFITLTGNISLGYSSTVLVKEALLSQYKSAAYWSSYAEAIIGV